MAGANPKNNLQRRLKEQELDNVRPDISTSLEAPCIIVKVYDAESEAIEDFPERVKDRVGRSPGTIFCDVLLRNGRTILLPLQDSAEQIYAVYGNSVVLERTDAKITYRNYDIGNGVVVPVRSLGQKILDLASTTNTADIGAIIGI